MAGQTDLASMLATLQPDVRPGEYVFVCRPHREPVDAQAFVTEEEGVTHIVTRATADELGWTYDFIAAWITLRVHSSLAAVGLTAAVSTSLAERGISCNMVAGYFHDHLLVPIEDVSAAMAALTELSTAAR
jgi:hypothetical protein